MTESKELGAIRRKNASGTKMWLAETVFPSPLICEICEICGFSFDQPEGRPGQFLQLTVG